MVTKQMKNVTIVLLLINEQYMWKSKIQILCWIIYYISSFFQSKKCCYYEKIDVEKILETNAVNDLVEISKNDILEKRWETVLKEIQEIKT